MHIKCQDDWNKDRCPVCNEAIGDTEMRENRDIEEKYSEEIWRPGDEITIDVTDDDGELRKELEDILKQHNSDKE